MIRSAPKSPHALRRCRDAAALTAQSLWAKEERLRGSVFATCRNAGRAVRRSRVSAAQQPRSIDFDEWLSGDNTIYVVAASHEQARLRPS